MEFKSINAISDLLTFDELKEKVHNEYKNSYDHYKRHHLNIDTYWNIQIPNFISTIMVNEINNKKDVIKLLLDKSVNRFNQNINYYNIIINNLQNIQNLQLYSVRNKICSKILFTNTCTILYYKINNNIYNLYKFVENNLIDKFNTILLSCLLKLYYVLDITNNETITIFYEDSNLIDLYLFKYTQESQNDDDKYIAYQKIEHLSKIYPICKITLENENENKEILKKTFKLFKKEWLMKKYNYEDEDDHEDADEDADEDEDNNEDDDFGIF